MKLHEMTKDYIGLLESDIPQDQLTDCLDSIEDAIEEKASNIVKVVECLSGDVSVLDAEIKRLQARKKAITGNQERLKDYLRHNMEATGISKIKHPLFNISLGKPIVTADVIDVDFLPDEYVTVEVTTKADKRAILKALKDGEEIPGAVLSTGKSRLLIK